MADYRDLVMGTNGETSILDGTGGTGDPRPFAYFAMDVDQPIPNIGLNTDKTLVDPDLSFSTESLTLDALGADNSAGSTLFTLGGEQLQNYNALAPNPMDEYSVAVWFKPDLSSNDLLTATALFQNYNNPNGMILGILPGGGLLYSYHRNSTDGDGATALAGSITNGQREFVVGTVNQPQGRVRIYRSGALVQEATMNVGVARTAGSTTQRIGTGNVTKFGQPGFSTSQDFQEYNGLMAHLMIWNSHELSAAGVSALWAAGAGPSTVPIEITVTDVAGTPIENARVFLRPAGGGAEIVNGLTNASGVITASYSGAVPAAIEGWVRKSSAAPFFKQFTLGGSVTASGFSATALMVADQ